MTSLDFVTHTNFFMIIIKENRKIRNMTEFVNKINFIQRKLGKATNILMQA